MESTDNPKDQQRQDVQAKKVRIEAITVHAFLDGHYDSGDYISEEAMAEAFKKNPNPNVVLNSDHKAILGRVIDVKHVGHMHSVVTMRLESDRALRWLAKAQLEKKEVVFGIDCRILEKKGNVITKADFMSVSLIPAQPYEPANPDAQSLGKFTLEENKRS